jgi:hypothetical protein
MPEALIAGERDPLVLTEPAVARMRGKREILTQALTSRFTGSHWSVGRIT